MLNYITIPNLLCFAAYTACLITIFSHLQGWLGVFYLKRFRQQEVNERNSFTYDNREWPKISILKPLHGDEPLLREALESFCTQHYPDFEIIFGFHSKDDKALKHIPYLREKYPDISIKTVISDASHGINGKVNNLINMYPEASHDYIIIADSDMHVSPTYLKHVACKFYEDNSDLVTTLYAAHATKHTVAAILGCLAINLNFMTGVLLGKMMKRQDCLGATMAFHKSLLEKVGGFKKLVNHIADDALLGKLVVRNGGRVQLASVLTHTGVPETRVKDLIIHEIRWGRTTRSVSPLGYASSIFQLPLFWSFIALVLIWLASVDHLLEISIALIFISWLVRALMERAVLKSVRYKNEKIPLISPFLLPIRDIMSGVIILISLIGSQVVWKGTKVEVSPLSTSENEKSED